MGPGQRVVPDQRSSGLSDVADAYLRIGDGATGGGHLVPGGYPRTRPSRSRPQRWLGSVNCGAIFFGRGGLVKCATGSARKWLRAYFGQHSESARRLPEPLDEWVRSQGGARHAQPDVRAFSVALGCRSLIVRLFADGAEGFFVLEERRSEQAAMSSRLLGLTRRETEVLWWVGEGKTNPVIGAILSISPRTVKKHLERIYRKLGVETRTAAARAFADHYPPPHFVSGGRTPCAVSTALTLCRMSSRRRTCRPRGALGQSTLRRG